MGRGFFRSNRKRYFRGC